MFDTPRGVSTVDSPASAAGLELPRPAAIVQFVYLNRNEYVYSGGYNLKIETSGFGGWRMAVNCH
jgi:hypothetical protein